MMTFLVAVVSFLIGSWAFMLMVYGLFYFLCLGAKRSKIIKTLITACILWNMLLYALFAYNALSDYRIRYLPFILATPLLLIVYLSSLNHVTGLDLVVPRMTRKNQEGITKSDFPAVAVFRRSWDLAILAYIPWLLAIWFAVLDPIRTDRTWLTWMLKGNHVVAAFLHPYAIYHAVAQVFPSDGKRRTFCLFLSRKENTILVAVVTALATAAALRFGQDIYKLIFSSANN